MDDRRLVTAGGMKRQVDRAGHVAGFHRRAELPRDDVPAVVVEDGRQVETSPADDIEIGEVGLPELVGPGGLVPELVGGPDHDMRRRGDEVLGLEDAVCRGFRDQVPLLVGVADRQLPRREVFVLERKLHDVPANLVGDTVPDRPGSWGLQASLPS